jgi:putative phosphoserine phosphatase/1-acylglycerol-3-phosphate O-acyltransferase
LNPSDPVMNARLAERLAQIAAGPSGPQVGAFFDFDGTLIDGFSAAHLVKDRWKKKQLGLREVSELLTFGLMKHPADIDFMELIENAIGRWKGMAEADIAKLWERIFVRDIAQTVFPEAWQLVQAHRRAGHTVAVASSATRWQIEPAAREFGIAHVLATPVEVRDGLLTGKLGGAPLWNTGKARAVQAFAKANGVVLERSYGYANGDEDIAFLSALRLPMAINPKPLLAATAAASDWPATHFEQRRKRTLEHRLRTTASYAAMAGTFVGGLAANALGLPKGRARNLVTTVAPELALAAAGIELRVQGEENLWKARPAVFVFNHQSPLDLVIGVQLMRRDATGVVKAEIAGMLGWGQFARFMDLALVDRADPDKARAALAPAVEKLKQGLSLGICPEGTRSYSPKLGAFKKGAFHLALQAQVPIVPVVMRNVGDVMHRDSAWMRPGVVDICVLPPIDTSNWTRETLDRHIAEVRQQFIDTLADWPGSTPPRPAAKPRRKATTGAPA